jgi:hypothetical protein
MFVGVHHSAAGTLFRFRTELAVLAVTATGSWELAKALTVLWAVAIMTAAVAVVGALPWTRRFVIGAGLVCAVAAPHPKGLF